MVTEARALTAAEITKFSTPEFIAHLDRAVAFMSRAVEVHHRFNGTVMVRQADYLVHAVEWTGLSPAGVLQTLQGMSPISAGAVDELNRLTGAISADSEATRSRRRSLSGVPGPSGPAHSGRLRSGDSACA